MAINEALVIFRDVKEISQGAVEFIVLEVAKGASVRDLHECHEDLVPNPIVVNRWRRAYPAFDMLMKEAEEAAAQGMAHEVIGIADDPELQAAQARNAMEARKWLAGTLDGKYGSGGGGGGGSGGGVVINQSVRLTDAQLMAIAAGKMDAIEVDSDTD